MNRLFTPWLKEVEDVQLFAGPSASSGLNNMLYFGTSDADALTLSVMDVDAFVIECSNVYRRKATEAAADLKFYCWTDIMLAQIRMSAVNAEDPLPFRSSIEIVTRPSIVGLSWLIETCMPLTGGSAGLNLEPLPVFVLRLGLVTR